MGYNNDQIKVAMQKSGIPEQETIKLINFKPFYLRAWFFVPVILALIFVGLLGAFVLDEFVFISEPVNEIDLIEDEISDDSSSTRTTTDEVVDEDDETEVSCGDGVCDSGEDCALDCGCETDDECSVYGSYLCGSGGECYYTIGTTGSSSGSSSSGSSSSGSSSSGSSSSTSSETASAEICYDELDEDGDGLVDCDDDDCFSDSLCLESGNCADGYDNDLDGVEDCDDDYCSDDEFCVECVDSSTCVDGFGCDDQGGCYNACTADTQCADGYECDTDLGGCVEIEVTIESDYGEDCSSLECVDPYVCSASDVCVECVDSSTCVDGFGCDEYGGCYNACTADTQCADGYECDTDLGGCVEETASVENSYLELNILNSCVDDLECGINEVCVSFLCYTAECSDSIDNDDDGYIDVDYDSGCESEIDNSELSKSTGEFAYAPEFEIGFFSKFWGWFLSFLGV